MASILTPTCLDTCPICINFLTPSIRHPHPTPLSVVQSQAQLNVRTEAGRRWDRLTLDVPKLYGTPFFYELALFPENKNRSPPESELWKGCRPCSRNWF